MSIKIGGFRRPFAISVASNGYVVCLTKAPQKKLYIFSSSKVVISSKVSQIGISSALFLAVNNKNEIIILDDKAGTLNWFDFDLNKLNSVKLPGSSYGAMKLDSLCNYLYISVLDLTSVFRVNLDGSDITSFFDYSKIENCSGVNGLAIDANRMLLLDTVEAALFDVSLTGDEFEYDKYLQYGRDGEGKVRNPSDVNILANYIVVHDYHNYFVQLFDKNFEFIFQVGGKGQGANEFDLPVSGYAVNDELYICDQNNDRIVHLDVVSQEFRVFAEDEFIEGFLRRPSGLAVDSNKAIYVADRSNGVIQKFDSGLRFKELLNIENIKLNRPSSISVLENNKKKYISIIERKAGKDSVLNIYLLSEDEKTISIYNQFDDVSLNDPQDMCSSQSGYFYVADTLNRRIIQIDLGGKLINQVNVADISNNQRVLVKTVFVREDGDVFTADFDECIVYQFDYKLRIKNTINFSYMKKEMQVLRAVYATKDYLLLCVRGENEVLMADYQGIIIKAVDCKTQTGLDWNHPVKICATDDGEILIADKENDRIIKFNKYLKNYQKR